jgi:hypothetical protein
LEFVFGRAVAGHGGGDGGVCVFGDDVLWITADSSYLIQNDGRYKYLLCFPNTLILVRGCSFASVLV